MRTKSRTRRPGQVPRWTMKPTTSAKIEQATAATELKRSEFHNELACSPRYWKWATVKVRFTGKANVSALTTSVPYTVRMTAASIKHAAKQARVSPGGTGGRGIEDALPPTVTNERPRSRRAFVT